MRKAFPILMAFLLIVGSSSSCFAATASLSQTLMDLGKKYAPAAKLVGKAFGQWWSHLPKDEKERYKVVVANKIKYKECPVCQGYRCFVCPGETVQTASGYVQLPCQGGYIAVPTYQDMWGNWQTQLQTHIRCNGYGAVPCPTCGGAGFVKRF